MIFIFQSIYKSGDVLYFKKSIGDFLNFPLSFLSWISLYSNFKLILVVVGTFWIYLTKKNIWRINTRSICYILITNITNILIAALISSEIILKIWFRYYNYYLSELSTKLKHIYVLLGQSIFRCDVINAFIVISYWLETYYASKLNFNFKIQIWTKIFSYDWLFIVGFWFCSFNDHLLEETQARNNDVFES